MNTEMTDKRERTKLARTKEMIMKVLTKEAATEIITNIMTNMLTKILMLMMVTKATEMMATAAMAVTVMRVATMIMAAPTTTAAADTMTTMMGVMVTMDLRLTTISKSTIGVGITGMVGSYMESMIQMRGRMRTMAATAAITTETSMEIFMGAMGAMEAEMTMAAAARTLMMIMQKN